MNPKRYIEPYGVFGAMVGDVERPTPSYMVTVQGGTLQDGRTQGSYPAGSTITVTYTARPGYRFDYWRIEGVSDHITDNPYTFTLTRPMSLVAIDEQMVGWNVDAIDWTYNGYVEDTPVTIATDLSCGVTGKYTLNITRAAPPEPNDYWYFRINGEEFTGRGSTPATFTTANAYDKVTIEFQPSRNRTWEFDGTISCEGYDEPLTLTMR